MNEINTIPGSLSHYLWVEPRLAFTSLLLDLLDRGRERPAASHSSAGSDGSAPARRRFDREQAGMSWSCSRRRRRHEVPCQAVGLRARRSISTRGRTGPICSGPPSSRCLSSPAALPSSCCGRAHRPTPPGFCSVADWLRSWYFCARYLGWLTTSFVVTSQRIVYRTGVLSRTGQGDPYRPRAGRDLSPDHRRTGREGGQPHRRVRRSSRPGPLSRHQQTGRGAVADQQGRRPSRGPGSPGGRATGDAVADHDREGESQPVTDPTPQPFPFRHASRPATGAEPARATGCTSQRTSCAGTDASPSR